MTWITTEKSLKKKFTFKNFIETIDFINKIAPFCEELNHHPDFKVHSYNQLTFSLFTHDSNSISDKDYNLAERIDSEFLSFKKNI